MNKQCLILWWRGMCFGDDFPRFYTQMLPGNLITKVLSHAQIKVHSKNLDIKGNSPHCMAITCQTNTINMDWQRTDYTRFQDNGESGLSSERNSLWNGNVSSKCCYFLESREWFHTHDKLDSFQALEKSIPNITMKPFISLSITFWICSPMWKKKEFITERVGGEK